jgi:prepilin-type N-terminal cleavage/methylation domain-containing protein
MRAANGSERERAARAADRGFTVVELSITIALLAVVVVPLLLATTTGIKASSTNRDLARVETALQNAADRVNRADAGTCSYLELAQAAVAEQGWDASLATVTQQVWKPGTTPVAWSPQGACSTVDKTVVQRIDITVSSPSGKIRRTLQVVKGSV